MPQNSSRAHFNPLNETNGTYKDNFFKLLHKIINYWGLKGLGRQFKATTLYFQNERVWRAHGGRDLLRTWNPLQVLD